MDPCPSPEGESPGSSSPDASSQEALAAGSVLGDFEIIRIIGSGGFGTVYLARDRSLEREVAIKEFLPVQLACRREGSQQITLRSQANGASFQLGLRSFVNEARILARFNHPGIVKVHRFWEANGTAYMVMPYLRGPTLRDVRRSMKESPTEAWLRGIIDPLLDALAMLHAEGIFHRDIAPDNILLPSPHEPVLLDFGAARRVIGDHTQTLTAVLKPSYAPIEQYAEDTQLRQGPWTDLYALGAVVVYMLNALPPPPSTVRSMHDEVPRLLAQPPAGVSVNFLAAIQWALAVRPQDRPQSVQQFRNALDGRIPTPEFAPRESLVPDEEIYLDIPPMAAQPVEHSTQPSMHRMQASRATWDTTLRLSDAPQAVKDSATKPAQAKLPTPSAREKLARLREQATWPKAGALALSFLVLLACGATAAWLGSRRPEPTAATWHALAKHAKKDVIIEERESDSRPVTISSAGLAIPVAAAASMVQAASVVSGSGTFGPKPLSVASESPPKPREKARERAPIPRKPGEGSKAQRVAAAASPREACGDRNFFSRAICMNRKCDEPAFRRHPQCVALLQQRENTSHRWEH
ncbi:serine/threonine protein kinase [Piscinibacter terrae]|uniref:Serine/threonine protein kinase n=1 Tax=Piscinibacter terrae TaxID=2496871 RepID=A0A3N7JXM6_9BURK|nr:serine/threonine-protein kinase [Albitalea terrae]RQP23645.1 serine/threonine protein kinase [Albitalea terrae]